MDPAWHIPIPDIRPDQGVIRRGLSIMEQLYLWEQNGVPDLAQVLDAATAVGQIRWQIGQDGYGPAYPLHALIERARERGWRIVIPSALRQEITPKSHVWFLNMERHLAEVGWYPVLCGGGVADNPFWHWPRTPMGPRLATVEASLAQLRHGLTQLIIPWACDPALAPPIPARLLHPVAAIRARLRQARSLAEVARRWHFPYATLHRLASDAEDATATIPLMHALATRLGLGIRWMPGRPA